MNRSEKMRKDEIERSSASPNCAASYGENDPSDAVEDECYPPDPWGQIPWPELKGWEVEGDEQDGKRIEVKTESRGTPPDFPPAPKFPQTREQVREHKWWWFCDQEAGMKAPQPVMIFERDKYQDDPEFMFKHPWLDVPNKGPVRVWSKNFQGPCLKADQVSTECLHPISAQRHWMDAAIICDECNCAIEAWGEKLTPPIPVRSAKNFKEGDYVKAASGAEGPVVEVSTLGVWIEVAEPEKYGDTGNPIGVDWRDIVKHEKKS